MISPRWPIVIATRPQQDPGVDQAEPDQPQIAAKEDVSRIRLARRFEPAGEQDHPRPEQQGEQAALGALEADVDQ
ncbi:MAG: hypothetical protein LH485_07165 [Sphingomonas bacterium]|nr:hypothetical protein [Sphingomonas bacterium]